MDKINDLNPKNAIYNAYKKKVKDIISHKASELYKDKEFADEYKGVYLVASVLRGVANLLSSATFTIAVYLALSFVIPKLYALIIALVSSILFELLKNRIWNITAKTTLKYKRVSLIAVCVLAGLHIVSIGGSIFGAWQLTTILPKEQPSKAILVNIDSINKSFSNSLAILNTQISALEKKDDWNSRVSLKEIVKQKTSLLNSQKEAQKEAKGANVQALKNYEKTTVKRLKNADFERSNIRKACVIVTAFFELAFILCSIFIAYYLFRRHIDDTHNQQDQEPNVKTANVQASKQEQPTTGQEAPGVESKRVIVKAFRQEDSKRLQDNSSKGKELEYTRICQLSECKTLFIHSIHNQKYCTAECRKLAYLKRKK